jgi:hypothetical protein
MRGWYNYKTGEYDFLDYPRTVDEAIQYIPNTEFAYVSFIKYCKCGFSVLESMKKVLTLFILKEV